jgi:replicative DNA helicase
MQPETTMPSREPPHNFEAEQALLGAILNNNEVFHRCAELMDVRYFADPLHGRLFKAMKQIIDRGLQANVFALKTWADADADVARIGGSRYLAGMLAVSSHEPKGDARIVRDLHLRRELIAISADIASEAYADDPAQTAVEQIEVTERRLYDLAATGHSEGGFQPFAKALTSAIVSAETAYKRKGALVGLSTGMRALDSILGGLHRSDLVVLAGRPSMGKTALATNIAFNIAEAYRTEPSEDDKPKVIDGGVVAFYSLEMSAEQLATRIIAEQSEVPSERIRRGDLNQVEYERVIECVTRLERAPLYIDDTAALTISALRTRARRLKRQHGLQLVVVDYLQLINPPANRNRGDGRVQEVSEITRGLKTLAKELDVPVLALSQLSRAVEQREDKKPQLSDLRESGSIEQDADVVMFVYRDEYYARKAEPRKDASDADRQKWRERMIDCAGKADVLVEKQRHGPTGDARLAFDGKLTRFSDWEDGR